MVVYSDSYSASCTLEKLLWIVATLLTGWAGKRLLEKRDQNSC